MFPFLFSKDFLILWCQTIKTGGNRVNSASKIMKTKVLNQLKSLIKSFNVKNADIFKAHNEKKYKVIPSKYERGKYSAKIEYTIFFSTDFDELLRFCRENNISIALMTYPNSEVAYMYIQ
jgi:hypothetical protein